MNETKIMTPDEFANKLKAIEEEYGGDWEVAHVRADDLICELLRSLGYSDGADVFDEMGKWYA